MDNCLFCKIIRKEIPAQIALENERILAFYDIQPQAPLHLLIIPKKHIESAYDLSTEDQSVIGEIAVVGQKLVRDLGFKNGFRMVNNCKNEGGQTVDHIHYHFLAGRSLAWPPG